MIFNYFFLYFDLSTCLRWLAGLPVTGGGLHQSAESDEVVQTRDSKDQETGREIMLVIAGGEGYVDFRRGRLLTLLTLVRA